MIYLRRERTHVSSWSDTGVTQIAGKVILYCYVSFVIILYIKKLIIRAFVGRIILLIFQRFVIVLIRDHVDGVPVVFVSYRFGFNVILSVGAVYVIVHRRLTA